MGMSCSVGDRGDVVRPGAAQSAVELDSIGKQLSLRLQSAPLERRQAGERVEHGEIVRLALFEQPARLVEEPPAELDLRAQAAQTVRLVLLLEQRILHAPDRCL